jgi:hypothetical protein
MNIGFKSLPELFHYFNNIVKLLLFMVSLAPIQMKWCLFGNIDM